jgi:uncharacterized protein (DUF433 family)
VIPIARPFPAPAVLARAARRLAPLALALGAGAALPTPARAWDDVGHLTVAVVAWRTMSPEARARAVALLRAAPPDAGLAQLRPNAGGPEARDLALFARAATWPDIVKDRRDAERFRTYNRGGWHYVDTYWRTGAGGRPEVVTGLRFQPENIVERLQRFLPTLGDAARPAPQRAVELAWVLHLVGDLHQPLHAGSRVTDAHPQGDRGGNAVRVGSSNLHAVWDDLLDTDRARRRGAGADAKLAQAERVADRLMRRYPAASLGAPVAEGDPAAWARASLAVAQREVYGPEVVDGGPMPAGYRVRVRAVAEPLVALAGYRLAAALERALGGAATSTR